MGTDGLSTWAAGEAGAERQRRDPAGTRQRRGAWQLCRDVAAGSRWRVVLMHVGAMLQIVQVARSCWRVAVMHAGGMVAIVNLALSCWRVVVRHGGVMLAIVVLVANTFVVGREQMGAGRNVAVEVGENAGVIQVVAGKFQVEKCGRGMQLSRPQMQESHLQTHTKLAWGFVCWFANFRESLVGLTPGEKITPLPVGMILRDVLYVWGQTSGALYLGFLRVGSYRREFQQ